MKLTSDQIRFFRQNGYFKLHRVVSDTARAALAETICDHVQRKVQPFRVDDAENIVRLDQVVQRGGAFQEVATSYKLLDAMECLLGPNVELALNRHNHVTFNVPHAASFRLHRDVLQWSRSVMTAIVYLENSAIENGCTHLVPGSHSLPFIGRPNNGGTWMDEHKEFRGLLEQAVPVPMPAGSVLIIDGLAFHSVGINNSSVTRTSLCLGFHSVDELASVPDPRKFLVRGSRIYKGNDQ